jgi:hypothetical protein
MDERFHDFHCIGLHTVCQDFVKYQDIFSHKLTLATLVLIIEIFKLLTETLQQINTNQIIVISKMGFK